MTTTPAVPTEPEENLPNPRLATGGIIRPAYEDNYPTVCPDKLSHTGRNHAPQNDMVNHPKHYNSHPKGIEAIDVIEDCPYPNLANVLKYVWRTAWGGKFDDLEDLEKAGWYLNREISRRKSAAE